MYKLYGYPLSPFLRKVRLTLEHKGLDYDLDPLVPFTERERVLKLNPKGSIPILETPEGKLITESSDICSYLDEHHPETPPVYPADTTIKMNVKAAEQWADTALMSTLGAGFFFQRIVLPFYLNREGDKHRENTAISQLPSILNELENTLGNDGYLVESFSVADMAAGSWMRGAVLAGYTLDDNFPKVKSYFNRVFSHPTFEKVIKLEEKLDAVEYAKEKYSI